MATTVWRGFITFGLVSVPVRLFRAARAERVSFRRMYRAAPSATESVESNPPSQNGESDAEPDEDAPAPAPARSWRTGLSLAPAAAAAEERTQPVLVPLQQASVQKGTDEIVPEKQVVKGFEYEKGRFVAIDPEELKSLAPKTATEMEIQEFVRLSEIDPVYFETSYYVSPEEAGQKAYALLYKALVETQLVALAQVAMHSREHVVVIRPGRQGIIAHTMFFESEVRSADEYKADATALNDKEMQLAHTLVHSLAAPFEPAKYRDRYREKIEEMIAEKVNGHQAEKEQAPVRTTAVVDIAEALRKSLQNLKKPPASNQNAQPETAARGQRPKKTRSAAR